MKNSPEKKHFLQLHFDDFAAPSLSVLRDDDMIYPRRFVLYADDRHVLFRHDEPPVFVKDLHSEVSLSFHVDADLASGRVGVQG